MLCFSVFNKNSKFVVAVLCILFGSLVQAQKQKKLKFRVTVDTNFVDTLSFTQKWSYRWDIFKDDLGKFFKNFEGELTKEDTVHLFHRANIVTNHQGEHKVKYLIMYQSGDTIVFKSVMELPLYASYATIYMVKDKFGAEFWATYPVSSTHELLKWKIKSAKLILDKKKYIKGDTIKGYIDLKFIEIFKLKRNPTWMILPPDTSIFTEEPPPTVDELRQASSHIPIDTAKSGKLVVIENEPKQEMVKKKRKTKEPKVVRYSKTHYYFRGYFKTDVWQKEED